MLADASAADVGASFLDAMETDAEERLRAQAGRALAERIATAPAAGEGGAADRLLRRCLEPGEDQLRFRALAGLREAGLTFGQLETVLERAPATLEPEGRLWALDLAGAHAKTLGADRLLAAISGGLRDPEPKVREAALRQLAAAGSPPAPALGALRDPEWNVRLAAVRALEAGPAGPEVLRALEDASRLDANAEVRARAAAALKRQGGGR